MHNCLIIVDVQHGFINEHTAHVPNLAANIQSKYKHVYISRFYNEHNSFFRSLILWHQFAKNSSDFQLAFQPAPHAIILDKNIYSCVTPKFLEELNALNINKVDICGIDTDICVTKCAVDLFENHIAPRVLADYCGSSAGKVAHYQALNTLERFIGKDQIVHSSEKKHYE